MKSNAVNQEILQLINELDSAENNCNDVANKTASLLKRNADVCFIKIPKKRFKRKKRRRHWENPSCDILKAECKKLSMLCKTYPNDKKIRSDMFKVVRQYNREGRKIKRAARATILKSLESAADSNPKEYWKLVDKLRNFDKAQKSDDAVGAAEFLEHFRKLFGEKKMQRNTDFEKLIEDEINRLRDSPDQSGLNHAILLGEVVKAIKDSKLNKSSGYDGIIYEWLKQKIFSFFSCYTRFALM